MSAVVWAPQCAATCSRPRAGLEEELERALPLVDPEEQPFPGRPECEQAVEAAGGEEVDVGAERALVQPVAVERRHGRGQGTSQHDCDSTRALRALDVGEPVERPVDPGVVDAWPAVDEVDEPVTRVHEVGARCRRGAGRSPIVPVR